MTTLMEYFFDSLKVESQLFSHLVMEAFNDSQSGFNGSGEDSLLEDYELHLVNLVTIIFPLVTIVGNWAVILAVVREKSLKNSTNFLIVSLAVADLLVGLIVMPWGIFALVRQTFFCSSLTPFPRRVKEAQKVQDFFLRHLQCPYFELVKNS